VEANRPSVLRQAPSKCERLRCARFSTSGFVSVLADAIQIVDVGKARWQKIASPKQSLLELNV
jgi:hypothetical protein